jgi:DNA-directed RNA polymerase sigma subunit (sigma70/sigma32)
MDALYTAKAVASSWILESRDEPDTVASALWSEFDDSFDVGDADQKNNVVDPVRIYLREISRIPLLRAEEEIALAQRIECGKRERLKPGANANQYLIEDGERAKRHLIEANLRLQQELGREPTLEELGEKMGMCAEQVHEIMKYSQDVVSLELLVNGEEDTPFVSFIEDRTAVAPADDALQRSLKEHIEELLEGLSERECQVLHLLYGLDDDRHTLKEAGEELGVTREPEAYLSIVPCSPFEYGLLGPPTKCTTLRSVKFFA